MKKQIVQNDRELLHYWKKKTVVSFILAIFVVLIHLNVTKRYVNDIGNNIPVVVVIVQTIIQKHLVTIAVPSFFVLSGVSFFRNYNNRIYFLKLQSRLKTLLIPYLAWNTIITLLYIVLYYTPLLRFVAANNPIVLEPKYLLDCILLYKRIPAFWFLFNLFIFVCLSPIFDFVFKDKLCGGIALIVLLMVSAKWSYFDGGGDCVQAHFSTIV